MKRFISLAIITSIAFSYTVPVLAINEKENSKVEISKKDSKKITQTQDKFQYININWWKNFNDEYLNSYIIKAIAP